MKQYILLAFILLFFSCKKEEILPDYSSSATAEAWGKMTLRIMYQLPSNTPVNASRAMGYAGLTMYECVVNGRSNQKSMVGQKYSVI